MIQQLEVNSNDSILCSFDICSLFTNIPLAETIKIFTETLYDGHLPPPVIPKHVFIELMNTATTSLKLALITLCTGKLMESLWVVTLVTLLWKIYLLGIMNQSFSMELHNLPYTVVTFSLFHTFCFSQRN